MRSYARLTAALAAVVTFVLFLRQGLVPPPAPSPGEMYSGGSPAVIAVAFSALLAALLAYAAVRLVFLGVSRLRDRLRKRRG